MGLEEVEERRGRGGVLGGRARREAARTASATRAGADQSRLRLERTDEAEPHAGGDDPARREEQMKPGGLVLERRRAARGARPRPGRGGPRGRARRTSSSSARAAGPRRASRRGAAPAPARGSPGSRRARRGGVAAGVELGEPLRRARAATTNGSASEPACQSASSTKRVEPRCAPAARRAAPPPRARRSGRSRRWGTPSRRAARRARRVIRTGSTAARGGARAAGSQRRSTPSARTSYVSGIDLHPRQRVVELHVALAEAAAAAHRRRAASRARSARTAPSASAARDTNATLVAPTARPNAPNIGRIEHRLRRRDRGVRVAHLRPGDEPALQHQLGLRPEERRAATARGRRACPARPSRPRRAMPCAMAGLMVYFAT